MGSETGGTWERGHKQSNTGGLQKLEKAQSRLSAEVFRRNTAILTSNMILESRTSKLWQNNFVLF